ncbi:ATP phosphoribosyltransferase regulatory subunit [Acidisoma cellulosilytica]|uniref:ATP phosphoribosyltransferase regulatory subunit n=1 Tax=Acidisoma cellulosilyticum TaxID=2802395 RepID=A0A963Z1I3_9PROT|nr:ATP phosphoribosyltransferase regulatory subunit [Acidisoma cellulosilyticum]MCB8880145.1 ATP phosphoribosyltransferase regulatory subunit [Acidisoma cellulosilyticum]
MTDDFLPNPALLPAGLRDLLPPDAEIEARSIEAMMDCFAGHGYQRVRPPLVEFEHNLLAGSGAAVSEQTFRLMDPDSQRMLGLRADTTPQVARIANTRLAQSPRPLRLSYAEHCLRVRGSQLAPDRQISQAGIELIGSDAVEADAEIVLAGAEALAVLGLTEVSFDLTLPTMAAMLLDSAGLPPDRRALLAHALDRKDAAAVTALGGSMAATLTRLLLAAGEATPALAALSEVDLPAEARVLADRLAAVVDAIRARAPALRLTVDPLEFRGIRYHTGPCVTVYALGHQQELGRGGRYISGEREPATGLTLFPDVILEAARAPALRPRLYLPAGTDAKLAARFRAEGYATVAALGDEVIDIAAEARRLLCSHLLTDGAAAPLS